MIFMVIMCGHNDRHSLTTQPVFTICLPSMNLAGICKEQRWLEGSYTKCEEGLTKQLTTCALLAFEAQIRTAVQPWTTYLPSWGTEIVDSIPHRLQTPALCNSYGFVHAGGYTGDQSRDWKKDNAVLGESKLICSRALQGWGGGFLKILKISKEALSIKPVKKL